MNFANANHLFVKVIDLLRNLWGFANTVDNFAPNHRSVLFWQALNDIVGRGLFEQSQVKAVQLLGGEAAQLEIELGKPVIAINVATLWHALRANDIDDQIDGFGSLLRDH